MFYLIYIYDTCNRGRMYGPDTFEVCYEKMQQYYAEDKTEEGWELSDDSLLNIETGEGWYIIQSRTFEEHEKELKC